MKNPDRTRKLINQSQEPGAQKVRFSVLSLTILDKIFAEFTPEELLNVDVIPLNNGSTLKKRATGKARERYRQEALRVGSSFEDRASQTIACVSGFLFNLVERSVKLISPCTASDRWPLGYHVYEESFFTSAKDLEMIVKQMIENHMPLSVPRCRTVRFRCDLHYEKLSDGFRVWTEFGQVIFEGNPFFGELGDIIRAGVSTAEEIGEHFFDRYGFPVTVALEWLDLMFQNGVLDEEPSAAL